MQLSTSRVLRRFALTATAIALTAAGTGMVAGAQTSEGCDPNVGTIQESAEFTAHATRLSHVPPFPITSSGHSASSEARLDGLPLRWEVGDGERASYQYYLGTEMRSEHTVPEFRAAGGIQLDRDAVTDGDPYTADDVIAQVGDRAVKVQIGEHDAALVWADPESNGARPHHLYWSDGDHNYTMIAVRGPKRMVQLGRALACGE